MDKFLFYYLLIFFRKRVDKRTPFRVFYIWNFIMEFYSIRKKRLELLVFFRSRQPLLKISFTSSFFYVECLSKLRLNSITNEIYIYSITEQKSIKQVTDFSSNQLEIQLGILRLFNRDSITAQSLQRN